jgi:integrase
MPADRKGRKWDEVRITKLKRDPIAQVPLRDLDATHVARWRDRSLAGSLPGEDPIRKPLKPASVRREWNLLSAVCSVAVGEWKWLKLNPFYKAAGAKRPKNSRHRDQLFLESDLIALQAVADAYPTGTYRQVMRCVRFCIETAMRAGEMMYLGDHPERVDVVRRVAHLPDTKNGDARDVPLSAEAIRIWEEAGKLDVEEGRGHWGLTPDTRGTHWRGLRSAAGREHLNFHDTRHTAITRLAKKLQNPLDLARMTGHNDVNELMTYYNESAQNIARLLD